jgi:hypothetical protein
MASYLTSDTLIDSVVRRAHLPESQITFTDEDFLAFANEEMQIGLIPAVMKMHEEFLVYSETVPLVANQDNYEIPSRAIGNKTRDIFYQDPATNLQELARINPDDLVYFQNSSNINYPRCFYVQNNDIILIPGVGATPQGSLIFNYFMRPNQLVAEERIATISNINLNTGEITVDAVPSVITDLTPCDFLQTKAGHKTLGIDKTPTNIVSLTNTITFDVDDIPSNLQVGDMIALAGETIIPQVPDELHSVLAQRIACRCLEAQKDTEGLQAANAKLQEMETNLGILIDNRTEGHPQKVNNLRGPLRQGKFRRRRSTW